MESSTSHLSPRLIGIIRAMSEQRIHWEAVYSDKDPQGVSWYESFPGLSLRLVTEANLPPSAALLDVGGGASTLAAELLRRGHTDITVADISGSALSKAQAELGAQAEAIEWVQADVRRHDFGRQYDLWHDRALFHFMVTQDDREAYLGALDRALKPGGHAVIATFGLDGPTSCSGLPVARYGSTNLATTLGDGFELISEALDVHKTPAGNEQQFLYAHLERAS
jgi:SAM-dependent methyltransferase